MNERRFWRLVNRVSDHFEEATNVEVDDSARHALMKPALPHLHTVNQELTAGKISVPFLEGSLTIVLENGRLIVREQGYQRIDEEVIHKSIARYCPYLFWC